MIKLKFLILPAFLLLFLAVSVSAQEWYITKRTEVIQKGKSEIGTRLQLIGDEDGILTLRQADLVLSLRHSPVQRFEIYVEGPLTYKEQQRIVNFAVQSFNDKGPGDVFTQFTYDLIGGQDWKILVSLDGSFPTGQDPVTHPIGLGGGFYRYAPGVTYLKVLDPAVLFFYLGKQWTVSNRFVGVGKIEPGTDVRFRFGGSFLLNPRLRVSAYSILNLTGSPRLDGVKLPNSEATQFRFGGGFGWDLTESVKFEINSTFGITAAAPDGVLSMGLKKAF